MDPDETLRLCLDSLCQKDYEACFYHCQDLRNWLNKGGFSPLPSVSLPDMIMWCQVTMKICKQQQWENSSA